MNEDRYSRQTRLKGFGPDSHARLQQSKVLIVGMGGLGIPAALYLNAMGVGTLGLMDADTIALHNLQRQVLYGETDVGKPKLQVAIQQLQDRNKGTHLIPHDAFLDRSNAMAIIEPYDLVIDASDNFATRYLINDACVILNKPFVYGALHAFEGQVSVFNYHAGPTYRCLFPTPPQLEEIPNCDDNGVLGVVPGIIGSLQALEAVKVLTGLGQVLAGELLIYDGLHQESRKIRFKKNGSLPRITALEQHYDGLPCTFLDSISSEGYLEGVEAHLLIDVREPHEFDEDHLPQALNIPLSELEPWSRVAQINEPIYLICKSGQRSRAAQRALSQWIPEHKLVNIEGGMDQIGNRCR